VGGYSPKSDAAAASFLQVGGYSPKSDAAAAKIRPKYQFLDRFGRNISQNVTFS
jgi:hypothetical protein